MAWVAVSGCYKANINWQNLISLSTAVTEDAICDAPIMGFTRVHKRPRVLACSAVAMTTFKALPFANSLCAGSKRVWGKFVTPTIFCRVGSLPGSNLQCVSSKALWSIGMVQHVKCIGTEIGMVQMVCMIDRWSLM